MPRWLALLLFPLAPIRAAQRLGGSWLGALVPFVLLAAASGYLLAGGARGSEILPALLTLARLLAGIATGGLAAAWIGTRLVGRAARVRELAGPVLAAAGWAPAVFVLFLALGHATGAGPAAALYAGIALLIWGVAAGFGIIAGDHETEAGRMLVASCLGLGGVLIGLWMALAAPPAPSVILVPAPAAYGAIRPGDLLLVDRRNPDAARGLVLLREPGTNEALLAARDRNGSLTPVGEIQLDREKLQDWNIDGRVFFQFGAGGGRSVPSGEQIPNPSRN